MTLKELIVILRLQTESFKTGLQNASNELGDFKTEVSSLSGEVSSAFDDIGRVIGSLAGIIAKVALGMTAFFGVAVWEASKFENSTIHAWQQIANGAIAAGKEYENFRQEILLIARDSEHSANEVAGAMLLISNRAESAASALAQLKEAMKLATATGEDLGTSADMVSRAIMIFGKTGLTEAQAANYFAVMTEKGAMKLGDLSMAFRTLFPMAAAMGWQFKDMGAVLGVLSTKGIEGYRAIFALQSILDSAMDPTKGLGKSLADAGIEIVNSSGKVKGLLDIITSLKSLGWTTQDVYKQFGTSMGTVFATILNTGVDAFKEFSSAMDTAANGTETLIDKQDKAFRKSLPGIWEEMVSSAKTSFTIIGEDVAGAITPIISLFTEWSNKIVDVISSSGVLKTLAIEMSKALEPLKEKLIAVSEEFIKWIENLTAEDITKGINGFVEGINSLANSIASLIPNLATLIGMLSWLMNNAEKIAGMWGGMKIGAAMGGPVGAVAGGVGGMGVGGVAKESAQGRLGGATYGMLYGGPLGAVLGKYIEDSFSSNNSNSGSKSSGNNLTGQDLASQVADIENQVWGRAATEVTKGIMAETEKMSGQVEKNSEMTWQSVGSLGQTIIEGYKQINGELVKVRHDIIALKIRAATQGVNE